MILSLLLLPSKLLLSLKVWFCIFIPDIFLRDVCQHVCPCYCFLSVPPVIKVTKGPEVTVREESVSWTTLSAFGAENIVHTEMTSISWLVIFFFPLPSLFHLFLFLCCHMFCPCQAYMGILRKLKHRMVRATKSTQLDEKKRRNKQRIRKTNALLF